MADTYADPPDVVGQVVDTVGRDLAQVLVHEIVHSDVLWVPLRTQFSAAILEISD